MLTSGAKINNNISETIEKHFGTIPEPRLERTRLYELPDILVYCDMWDHMVQAEDAG